MIAQRTSNLEDGASPTPDDYRRPDTDGLRPTLDELRARRTDLNMRDLWSKPETARFLGRATAEPLLGRERLELLALSTAIAIEAARQDQGIEIDRALNAGASWP